VASRTLGGSLSMARTDAVAVIDIGSNSGRVVVYALDAAGRLRILAATRAALRLVNDVDETRMLSRAAVDRALEALRDFRAIALGAGARRIRAVATAAMRDAANGPALIARIRKELRIHVEIIDGEQEAEYGFRGALRGLPVASGLLFDLGGGSLQVSQFRERRLLRAWSFPLGALRLSHHFLTSDPPRAAQIRHLADHVRMLLEDAGLPGLRRDETLIGTGGTVRNLAKIDQRSRTYPIGRVHGYSLGRRRLKDIAVSLAERRLQKREQVAGLSDERGDSIVGGSIAVAALAELVGASAILVAGQGVREGIAYSVLAPGLPSVAAIREQAIASLASRFDAWRPAAARRRAALAEELLTGLEPETTREIHEALRAGARLLDIGRSIDFFDRHRHAAEITIETEMDGFSHREVALVAALIRSAGGEKLRVDEWAPLVAEPDVVPLARAAVVLALADDIEARLRPGRTPSLGWRRGRRRIDLTVPGLVGWRSHTLERRFRRLFGRELVVIPRR
jgi:exopolyphosphatase / guanosine-5'-triphosphate,3'-diphosphate pyrophosphatase